MTPLYDTNDLKIMRIKLVVLKVLVQHFILLQ